MRGEDGAWNIFNFLISDSAESESIVETAGKHQFD